MFIFVKQPVSGGHARRDDIAQRVEESALIVARAVEALAAGESVGGDVEHPPREVTHALAVGGHGFKRQLRDVVAELLALPDAPMLDQVPGRIEPVAVVEEANPQRRKPADTAPAATIRAA